MADKTGIQWTDATWNPTTGCTEISAGCDHCYAHVLAERLQKMGQRRYANGFEVTLHPDALGIPRKWRAPRRVFVNSMSDLFHARVPFEFVEQVWGVMADCPQHTFQILTKRPDRMRRFVKDRPILSNAWLGTSVEDQKAADQRIPELVVTPAAVRFLSCEPLIGPVRIHPQLILWLSWVIVGGESGPGHRPMDADWARSLRDQCVAGSVPYFFKQWGGPTPKSGGRELDGRTWDEMPGAAR